MVHTIFLCSHKAQHSWILILNSEILIVSNFFPPKLTFHSILGIIRLHSIQSIRINTSLFVYLFTRLIKTLWNCRKIGIFTSWKCTVSNESSLPQAIKRPKKYYGYGFTHIQLISLYWHFFRNEFRILCVYRATAVQMKSNLL